MIIPWQAYAGIVWAIVGIPLVVYAATRVRRGAVPLHAALMIGGTIVTVALVVAFGFNAHPSPRRPALMALPLFKVHLALSFATLGGLAWQLTSRGVARVRPLHRRSGPYVVLFWCLTLLTGVYNFIFLYVMGRP